MDTTYSVAPPGAASPPTARPAGPPPPQPANRKELDSRRVLARLIDLLIVGAPGIILATHASRSLATLLLSLMLGYFFLCEGLWGQTIGKRVMGLRVLMRDGRAATASAVSARTVLRVIEDNPIGLIVMVLSGRRRQRLGDLLGGTIVARATPGLPHAALSPMHAIYPVAWVIGAIAFALYTQPQADYLANVDQICAHRQSELATTPPNERSIDRLVAWVHADHRTLVAIKAPVGAKHVRDEIVALDAETTAAFDRAASLARSPADRAAFQRALADLGARRQRVAQRYAALGLRTCAGLGPS